ncbi:MAG TPA: PIN domain-containing protein [Vicinamibacteria bacterium]|nr:PIN domain-containing protein [Vicinamibacteria bacterium]
MILLDTSVLSAVLRRRKQGAAEARLASSLQGLLNTGQKVSVPGLVVQELLSGIREEAVVQRLKAILLRGYPVVTAGLGDHLLAADVANQCRRRGVTTSSGDALIAALAINRRATLFAVDGDFEGIARCAPLKLLET